VALQPWWIVQAAETEESSAHSFTIAVFGVPPPLSHTTGMFCMCGIYEEGESG